MAQVTLRKIVKMYDDVEAVRGLYGGRALRDGLLSAYTTDDQGGNDNALYAAARPTVGQVRCPATCRRHQARRPRHLRLSSMLDLHRAPTG